MNMKNLYNFARAMAFGRKIKPYDLDDIIQTALLDALERGVSDEEKFRGFVMINIMRFDQTRARVYKSPAVKPIHGVDFNRISIKDDGLSLIDVMDDVKVMMDNVNRLPDSLKSTIFLTLQGMDNHEISAIRGVKHRTVAVDRCRAIDMLRRM